MSLAQSTNFKFKLAQIVSSFIQLGSLLKRDFDKTNFLLILQTHNVIS